MSINGHKTTLVGDDVRQESNVAKIDVRRRLFKNVCNFIYKDLTGRLDSQNVFNFMNIVRDGASGVYRRVFENIGQVTSSVMITHSGVLTYELVSAENL